MVATPDLTPGLTELGYDRFQGNMQIHGTADRAALQVRMDRLHLALELDEVCYR